MWKQRYRNETLYPCNGPVAIKPRLIVGKKKLIERRLTPMELKPV
jgi:hypothetical protein